MELKISICEEKKTAIFFRITMHPMMILPKRFNEKSVMCAIDVLKTFIHM